MQLMGLPTCFIFCLFLAVGALDGRKSVLLTTALPAPRAGFTSERGSVRFADRVSEGRDRRVKGKEVGAGIVVPFLS